MKRKYVFSGMEPVNPYPDLPVGFFFDQDHFFNTPIPPDYPVDNNTQRYIDWYASQTTIVYGECTMPYNVVDSNKEPLTFVTVKAAGNNADYHDPVTDRFPWSAGLEMQNGPFLENDGKDHHLLVADLSSRRLYETYNLRNEGNIWLQEGCALFQCDSHAPRPQEFWQASTDAAGFPILPGLIRRDEVLRKSIPHALRITVSKTYPGYVSPATHGAVDPKVFDDHLLPMGARLRLRLGIRAEDFDEYTATVIRCLQKYGAYIADNGMNFALTASFEDTGDFPQCFRGHKEPGPNDKGTFHLMDKFGYSVRISDFEVLRLGEIHPLK